MMPNYDWGYDVFLSFRGADTRHNFAGHLYKNLDDSGIRTFRDDEELPRGGEIVTELIKAIERSRISIIIFSETYADSRWCRGEMTRILDCNKKWGQTVILVFYHDEPSEVEYRIGLSEKLFAYHERNAGYITHYHVPKDRYASEVIDEIVAEVRTLIPRSERKDFVNDLMSRRMEDIVL